jgi:hypothetical protein
MIPDVQGVLTTALASISGCAVYRTQAIEGAVAPYAVWTIVSAVPENQISGAPETDNARIQIDTYSKTQSQSRQMCELAQAAVEATAANVIFGPTETREADTKLWRWSFDSSWWNNRIGNEVMKVVTAPITLIPTEAGTVNMTPNADISAYSIVPAGSLSAATVTAADGSCAGQILLLSFVTMHAVGLSIAALTFGGSNFSAAELTYAGGPSPSLFYLFVWNGSKWVLIHFSA